MKWVESRKTSQTGRTAAAAIVTRNNTDALTSAAVLAVQVKKWGSELNTNTLETCKIHTDEPEAGDESNR